MEKWKKYSLCDYLTNVPYIWIHAGVRRWSLELQVTVSHSKFSWTIREPGNMCGCSLHFIRISANQRYLHVYCFDFCFIYKSTVKPVLCSHSKRRPKIGFQDRSSLNAGQKYYRMLQYFRPSLSYHLRP